MQLSQVPWIGPVSNELLLQNKKKKATDILMKMIVQHNTTSMQSSSATLHHLTPLRYCIHRIGVPPKWVSVNPYKGFWKQLVWEQNLRLSPTRVVIEPAMNVIPPYLSRWSKIKIDQIRKCRLKYMKIIKSVHQIPEMHTKTYETILILFDFKIQNIGPWETSN